MICPNCGTEMKATPAQAEAARRNGAKGGRPKGSKDKQPRKRTAQVERECCGTLPGTPHRITCEKYRGKKETTP